MLDATGLGSGAGGDETMLTGVLEGLVVAAREDDRFDVVAAVGASLPRSVIGDERFMVTRVARRPGLWHFSVTMPRLIRAARHRPDVVFSPTHGPLVSSVPVALMVQDLSFEHRPHDYPPVARMRLRQLVRRQVRSARVVLTVSDHARSDLIDTYGLDPVRVFTVPNAALTPTSMASEELRGELEALASEGVGDRFLLYLGNLHPRKNVTRAIEAFASIRARRSDLSDLQLVIAGGRWWGGGEQDAAAAAPPGSVVFLGRVGERRREALMRSAVALVYVSLFEGFGLPPLEAMARGTPVVASNRTSIPEVVGGGGVLVDPMDTAAIASAMIDVCTDHRRRDQLVAAGRARAATYTVARTGEAMIGALEVAARMDVDEGEQTMAEHRSPGRSVRSVDDYAADWEENARADARFAILSDPARNDRAWDADTDGFMTSGEHEIAQVLDYLDAAGLESPHRRTVLDFGCGIGRLTNALARRFDRAVGVDISPTMVEEATKHAVEPNVSFVVNRSGDLRRFDDGSFDLIYSNIVLQHVSNDLQRGYLVEFCRVLAPGGLAVLQLPSVRRGLKGTVRRLLPRAVGNAIRTMLRPAKSLRREGYTIHMEMNCLSESDVWDLVEGHGCTVAHTTYTNAAEASFNGDLVFMDRAAAWKRASGGGFVSPVYVIRRNTSA